MTARARKKPATDLKMYWHVVAVDLEAGVVDESGREIGEWSWDEKLDITDDWPRRDPEAAAAWRMARFGAPLSSQPVRDHWPPSGMRGILAQSAHSSVGSLTTARRTAHKLSADTQPAVLAIKAVPVVVTRLAAKRRGSARQATQRDRRAGLQLLWQSGLARHRSTSEETAQGPAS